MHKTSSATVAELVLLLFADVVYVQCNDLSISCL